MSFSEVLITAGAAFFVWHCLARVRPPGIAQLIPLLPSSVQRFLGCPWCCGAWLALGAAAIQGLRWPETVLVWLAAAALVGVTGSLLPDDGEAD